MINKLWTKIKSFFGAKPKTEISAIDPVVTETPVVIISKPIIKKKTSVKKKTVKNKKK